MTELIDKKLFLLDMDGTIYLGNEIFDGTIDFLNWVKENGGRYMFLTNNSSKSVDKYIEKLNKMGISAIKDDFTTSAQATGLYLQKNNSKDKMAAKDQVYIFLGISIALFKNNIIICFISVFSFTILPFL